MACAARRGPGLGVGDARGSPQHQDWYPGAQGEEEGAARLENSVVSRRDLGVVREYEVWETGVESGRPTLH